MLERGKRERKQKAPKPFYNLDDLMTTPVKGDIVQKEALEEQRSPKVLVLWFGRKKSWPI